MPSDIKLMDRDPSGDHTAGRNKIFREHHWRTCSKTWPRVVYLLALETTASTGLDVRQHAH
eukprot:2173546-Amphidinium_carterae.1